MRAVMIAIAIGAFAVVAGCGAGASTAVDAQPLANPPSCVSAGDSIVSGDNSNVYPPNNDNVFNATAYPWHLGQLLDVPVVNSACPGETSASFVTPGAPDRGCREFRETYDAMHVAYPGTQLDFVASYVATHSRVRLITLTIGADDLQLLQDRCLGDTGCILQGAPSVLSAIAHNVGFILGTLRGAGYTGQIIVPNYYNPTTSPLYDAVLQNLNDGVLQPVADAFGGKTADVFQAFRDASAPYGGDPCAAGLIIVHPDGSCGVHPSPKGARLIASTIEPLVAAWTGKP
jgi:lysophospholipase L1-like esterase